VLALVLPDGKTFTTEGLVRGVIAEKPSEKRTVGFPFRSVLYLPEIGKFYDHHELTAQETAQYNHRKHALEKMKPIIQKEIVC
jgi:XTP/dITP diphosphohydrolase